MHDEYQKKIINVFNASRKLEIESLNGEINSVVMKKFEFENREQPWIIKIFLAVLDHQISNAGSI